MPNTFPPTEPTSNTTVAIANAANALLDMLNDTSGILSGIANELAAIRQTLQDLVGAVNAIAEQNKAAKG